MFIVSVILVNSWMEIVLNIVKKFFIFVVFLFTILLLISCYSYRQLKIEKTIRYTNTDKKPLSFMGSLFSHRAVKIRKRYYIKKYLINVLSYASDAKLNNEGVEMALKGKFSESEIIFKEVVNNRCTEGFQLCNDFIFAAACNNLAIVHEVFSNKKKAFSLYNAAYVVVPDNRYIRNNILSFLDK